MAVGKIFAGMPWWVTWVAVPALALAVFGGMIVSVVGLMILLLFKVLLFIGLIAGLVYFVRKFTSSSKTRKDW
ncbi:DUF5326 family protein [Streptomyces sp. NPDC000594]|uniref:DUF5326 family protein n=1 Tax=Streptomyces sp. NPDC000594 TaxID=3154261 RepID=UPI003316AE64